MPTASTLVPDVSAPAWSPAPLRPVEEDEPTHEPDRNRGGGPACAGEVPDVHLRDRDIAKQLAVSRRVQRVSAPRDHAGDRAGVVARPGQRAPNVEQGADPGPGFQPGGAASRSDRAERPLQRLAGSGRVARPNLRVGDRRECAGGCRVSGERLPALFPADTFARVVPSWQVVLPRTTAAHPRIGVFRRRGLRRSPGWEGRPAGTNRPMRG